MAAPAPHAANMAATPSSAPSSSISAHDDDFRDYPFLAHDEFNEVCHNFDRIYRQATLGPLRRRWRVSVCTAFNTSFYSDSDSTTYLQITRPLEQSAADDELAGVLNQFSFGEDAGVDGDEAMAMAEDADGAVLKVPPASTVNYGYVTYEVHLHPTYRAPCLWFSLHGLPNGESPLSIDTAFRHLVPEQFQDRLRAMGSIGGISADVSSSEVSSTKKSKKKKEKSYFIRPTPANDNMLIRMRPLIVPPNHWCPVLFRPPLPHRRGHDGLQLHQEELPHGLAGPGGRLCRPLGAKRDGFAVRSLCAEKNPARISAQQDRAAEFCNDIPRPLWP